MNAKNYLGLFILGSMCFGAAHSEVSAQDCTAPGYIPPQCAAPSPAKPCRPKKGAPAAAPAPAPAPAPAAVAPAPQAAVAPALFAAPPASGQISGESTSKGLRGFCIRFPELHLELPTIQFPSLVSYRRNPEMYMDGGRAPLVQGAPAPYGPIMGNAQFGPGISAAPIGAPAAAPAPAPAPAAAPAPAPYVEPDCAAPAPSCDAPLLQGYVEEFGSEDETVLNELKQARRELAMYRSELQRLKKVLERVVDDHDEVAEAPAPVPASRTKSKGTSRSALANEGQRQRTESQPSRSEDRAAAHDDAQFAARPAKKNFKQLAAAVDELPPQAPVVERSSFGPPIVRSSKRTAYRPIAD